MFLVMSATLVLMAARPSYGQTTTTINAPGVPDWIAKLLQADLTVFSAIPEPADAPLLDANGNPVLDANGNPVSDPNEKFHVVIPHDFDPGHTNLVENKWLDGTGCPTNATVAFSNSSGTGIASFGTFTDPACTSGGDPKDKKNEGLLFVKTGPTNNFASAEADLKKVKGISPLFELGYDIRKGGSDPTVSPQGSHCGNGAPRFDVVTTDGIDHFIGCNFGTPISVSNAWIRLRWDPTNPATAFPPVTPAEVVERIAIVFDEGTDTGPDFFGAAILDNIDVNGMVVGHGPDED
jgi:hypothetical protein